MENMKDKKKNSRLLIITIIFVVILAIIGGTFAYWSWDSSENTNVTFKVDAGYSCSADGGGDIDGAGVLAPTYDCDGQYAIKREITLTPEIERENFTIGMDLWLTVKSIDAELSASENLRYVLTDSANSCTNGIISEGTFKNAKTNSKLQLLSESFSETGDLSKKYYLYIWLDGPEENSNTQNKNISLTLGGTCTETSIPEEPVLDPGMIPVTIANDGTVTTISANDSDWYDYYAKEWANVVLVDSDSRSSYLNTTGVTVDQSDILAYYVWIPRYKYQIWTTDATTKNSPQTINIFFEDNSEPISNGNAVGQYLTHPAFWWDDNNDGVVNADETLAGIWVGKFETSTEESSLCYTSSSKDDCNKPNLSPRILPNVKSLRLQSIENQFKTSLRFANGKMTSLDTVLFITDENNIYGLNTTSATTDSHMMKNSEWGAVAYLSHSQYGINDEIRVNNNKLYITGCGASTKNGASSTVCEIEYSKSTSYPQSTTGNITGIFDMSGGAFDMVMGNYNYTTNEYFKPLPEYDKYFDVYSNTSMSSCTIETCGGHALYETKNWYSDGAAFVDSNSSWFKRGNNFNGGSASGLFFYSSHDGLPNSAYSWRSVLITGVDA